MISSCHPELAKDLTFDPFAALSMTSSPLRMTPVLTLRIERIVVDAALVRGHEARLIHQAIEAELTHLFAAPVQPGISGATRSISVTNSRLGRASTPPAIGQQIARSIFELVTAAP